MSHFEFLEHTGDLKFRAYGTSLNKMFESCALAVSSVFSRGKKIKNLKKKEINIFAKDYESLLYNFIDELIYLLDAENFIVSKAKIKITENFVDKYNKKENVLSAIIYGDDSSRYKDLDAIKAPTYAEMYIKNQNDKWECQVVLDV